MEHGLVGWCQITIGRTTLLLPIAIAAVVAGGPAAGVVTACREREENIATWTTVGAAGGVTFAVISRRDGATSRALAARGGIESIRLGALALVLETLLLEDKHGARLDE